MAKNLVVVESPTKAKTLTRYLGKDFVVRASKGHVKDLPKNELGVDVEAGFAPNYVTVRGKGKVLKEISQLSKTVQTVFLAPDPDREGEAIAFHIADEIGRGKRKSKPTSIKRVLITEITKRGVKEAFAHPSELNVDRFNSQQARRILDRLVGYQISPLLWEKVRRGLSAGRVQSVTVRLVVDREREIEAFQTVEYWHIDALLKGDTPPDFWARLHKLDGKDVTISNAEEAQKHVEALEKASYQVKTVKRKERHKNPPAPFITSRLQQDAARKLRMRPKRTMMVAQRLYEGITLGDQGLTGLITYMRSDSTRVSPEALAELNSLVAEKFGKKYLVKKTRVFKNAKKAQDAHEAIRPTSVFRTPESVASFLNRDQLRLYTLIWKRFVASQMAAAVYDATTVDIAAGKYLFRATGSVLRFPGFLELYGSSESDGDEDKNGKKTAKLPVLSDGQQLDKLELKSQQHFTKPPPRFSEASLVRELEERGIGRPSTYASIISTIQDKEYVEQAEGRFRPTELGSVVTDLLVENFPNVLNAEFTANMEDELDKIEDGHAEWTSVLTGFYGSFSESLSKAKKNMRNLKRETKPTDIKCEECGANMVIRWGKNGSFLACSKYPDCRNTLEFKTVDDEIVVVKQELEYSGTCDKCGAPMVIKKGKFGRFQACSEYPKCRNTSSVSTKVSCPTCKKGELVEKLSRRRKLFFGCSRYPECNFATWDRPLDQTCESCGNAYVVQKTSRSGTVTTQCPKCQNQVET